MTIMHMMPAVDRVDAYPTALFYQLLHECNYPYATSRGVNTRADVELTLREHGFVLKRQFFESDGDNSTTWLNPTSGVLVFSHKGYTHVSLLFAGHDKAELEVLIEQVMGQLPEITRPKPPPVTTVPVYFWTHNGQRATNVRRDLDVPLWGDIKENYPAHVREALTKLVNTTMPKEDVGKLILWDGPPGGGKSFALRSLCREWKSWADIHYITDPERFFGLSEYMMSVLLAANYSMRVPVEPGDEPDEYEDDEDWDDDDEPMRVEIDPVAGTFVESEDSPHRLKTVPKYKLLIIEDAGEYLRSDAALRMGQPLSRLLNITDGMLGQGLKFLTLITTNEDIKVLHGATVRPGRCMAQIHFGPFTRDQGQAWLKKRGSELLIPATKDKASLGELYGILNGNKQITTGEQKPDQGVYL